MLVKEKRCLANSTNSTNSSRVLLSNIYFLKTFTHFGKVFVKNESKITKIKRETKVIFDSRLNNSRDCETKAKIFSYFV